MSLRRTSRLRRYPAQRNVHHLERPPLGRSSSRPQRGQVVMIVLLHTRDASEPPEDPVLAQLEGALQALGHASTRLMVDADVEPLVSSLQKDRPDLVFNMAEAFAGKSALESN